MVKWAVEGCGREVFFHHVYFFLCARKKSFEFDEFEFGFVPKKSFSCVL